MLIICPNCFAKFEVNDRLLKKNIQKFACSNCGERFEENLEALRSDETEPFNLNAQQAAAASTEVLTQEGNLGEQGRDLLGTAEQENAARSFKTADDANGPSFTLSQEDEDLSVQSLPEEFTPVREAKKSKGLWFVFIFLLVVVGLLAYAWYKRDDLLQQFPNVQKGIHLIMGKPYASLPSSLNSAKTDGSSASDQGGDVVQRPDMIAEVQEANEQEPADPTQDIMNESATVRPSAGQMTAGTGNRAVQAGATANVAPRTRTSANTVADTGHVQPLSMQGGTDTAEDVTLQEIDLNALPNEAGVVINAVSDTGDNLPRTNAPMPAKRYDGAQEMPVIIEEIHIDEDGIDLNGGLQPKMSEGVQSSVAAPSQREAFAPVGNSMEGYQNRVNNMTPDTGAPASPYGTRARGLPHAAVGEPIVLDEAVGTVIEEMSPAVQGTGASEQGSIQVKDVVFRYDTSLSSRPRLYVQGIVSNMSDQIMTMPALKVDMYDKDNKLIGTQTVPATSSKLGPNMAEFFFREIDPLPQGLVRRVNITAKN